MSRKRVEDAVTQKIVFADEDFKIYVQDHLSEHVDKAFHEEIEIKYYYEGESAVSIGSEVILAKAGDITIANPYEAHSSLSISENGGRYRLIIVDLDFLTAANRDSIDLRRILISEEKRFYNHIRDERLGAILRRIGEEMNAKAEYYKTVVQSLANEFFALLLREYTRQSSASVNTSASMKRMKIIAPALSYIHLHYAKRFSVEELAGACSISKYHFCRLFKEIIGLTPVQYITRYRIDVAEIMLKMGTGSITEIAWQCGFEDESYFYRCYKKLKGIAPGKSRKSK